MIFKIMLTFGVLLLLGCDGYDTLYNQNTKTSSDQNTTKDPSTTPDQNTSTTIKFNQQPKPVIKIQNPKPYQAGIPIVLDASGSQDDGKIISYIWKEGNQTLSELPTLTKAFSYGMHTITLEVTDDQGVLAMTQLTLPINHNHALLTFDPNAFDPIASIQVDAPITDLKIQNNQLFVSDKKGFLYAFTLTPNTLLAPQVIDTHKGYAINALYAYKNYLFAGANDNLISIYKTALNAIDADVVQNTVHTNSISDLVVLANSNADWLVSGAYDKTIGLYNLATQKTQTIQAHQSAITALATNDRYIVSASQDEYIKIWDGRSLRLQSNIHIQRLDVRHLILQQNTLWVFFSDGVMLWDFARGALQKHLKSSVQDVVQLGDKVFIASDREVAQYDAQGDRISTVLTTSKDISQIALNEGILAVGFKDASIRLYGDKTIFTQR